MYHPYFRGKQFELIAIRETAELMAEVGFVPIISPVRAQIRGLKKALDAICDAGGSAIVIVNPKYGDLTEDRTIVLEMLDADFGGNENLMAGVLLTGELTSHDVIQILNEVGDRPIALIHNGFRQPNALLDEIEGFDNISTSIFIEDDCGKLYQRKFESHSDKTLIRDGFERRRNRDHPEIEFFSDLHITYGYEGVSGFGDFLIVGDNYSESGGPAYTIAIHLTYLDDEQDNAMFVRHFLSIRQDTPKDPGGKFGEALNKLIAVLDSEDSQIFEGTAIAEFRELHRRGHFPGLGSSKKLSMIHHIETLAHYFKNAGSAD